MTEADKIRARIRELEEANAAEPNWGAAVGARYEEIRALKGNLAAIELRKTRSDTAISKLEQAADRMCRSLSSAHQIHASEDVGLMINAAWVDLENALKNYRSCK